MRLKDAVNQHPGCDADRYPQRQTTEEYFLHQRSVGLNEVRELLARDSIRCSGGFEDHVQDSCYLNDDKLRDASARHANERLQTTPDCA